MNDQDTQGGDFASWFAKNAESFPRAPAEPEIPPVSLPLSGGGKAPAMVTPAIDAAAPGVSFLPSAAVEDGVMEARAPTLTTKPNTAYVFPADPSKIEMRDFRQLVMSLVEAGASDITIQSSEAVRAEINQRRYVCTRRAWDQTDVNRLLSEIYQSQNAPAMIGTMNILDFSYDITRPDGIKQNFRVNATGIESRLGPGVEISMRPMPHLTPSPEILGLAPEVMAAMRPKNGLVIVSGSTGSGKSTSLAALVGMMLRDDSRPVKIIDLQAPIEYKYIDVRSMGSASSIGQSEVGRHVSSFAEGVKSSLRRKADVVIVGEARDKETIDAAILASTTGQAVYTTTHAGSITETFRRLMSPFSEGERGSKAVDMATTLRFLIVQYLVQKAGGGQIAVREYLLISDRVRDRLIRSRVDDWPALLMDEISGRVKDTDSDDMRQSLADDVNRLLGQGLIEEKTANILLRKHRESETGEIGNG